jgi:hypothetical protein
VQLVAEGKLQLGRQFWRLGQDKADYDVEVIVEKDAAGAGRFGSLVGAELRTSLNAVVLCCQHGEAAFHCLQHTPQRVAHDSACAAGYNDFVSLSGDCCKSIAVSTWCEWTASTALS